MCYPSPRNSSLKHTLRKSGFTLAELLIALAILGVIATFTIPKVLQAQQYQKTKAIVKEVAGMMSGAYTNYKLNNTLTVYTGIRDLTPFMNYVKFDTAGTYDTEAGSTGTLTCTPSMPCLKLHNGAKVVYDTDPTPAPGNGNYFGVANANHYVYFLVDSDGSANNTTVTDGPGKTLTLVLYYNGRVATLGECSTTADETYEDGSSENWCDPAKNPSWFSWN